MNVSIPLKKQAEYDIGMKKEKKKGRDSWPPFEHLKLGWR